MPRQSLKTKIETALKGDKNSEMVDKPNEEVENTKQEEDLSAIKSQQTYSKKVFEDFASFTAKNSKAMIVIYICSAIILLCSIALFITGDIFRAIIEVFFGVFFACYGQVIKFIMRQNNKKNYNTTDCYVFTEDTLNVKCKDANGVEISNYSTLYSKLYAVKRNKNYGYIYLNKSVAYIVSQENFKDVIEFNYVLNKIESAINQESFNKEVNKI